MGRRVRSLIAAFVAVIAISMTVTPALAVTNEQYNSSLSNFWNTVTGTCRTYHGTAIHIQLTTTANGGGTYSISVYRCSGGQIATLVGAAGSCSYPGFCGLGWAIALGGSQYAFYFKKTSGDYHDIINCPTNGVQMWSTS